MSIPSVCRLFVLVLALLCSASRVFAAETAITIGVPDLPRDLDILASRHPGAEFLRRALVGTLRDASIHDRAALRIADAMNFSPEGNEVRFRISPLARFSNGRPVSPGDVEYSLSRCWSQKLLMGVRAISLRDLAARDEETPPWVVVALEGAATAGASAEILASLGRCPIVERTSSEIFGADLGKGANLVSCGEYALSELKAGRELSMRRLGGIRSRTQASGAELLTLRGFSDGDSAIAALRAGTVDAFLTADNSVISRAQKDETLFALQCPIYTVVHRRGLKIDCLDRVLVSEIRYVG